MNKRQVFIRILKAAVLVSAVLAVLPVYVHASYPVGEFSGGFAYGTRNGELWHTVTITHSGKLDLNFSYTGSFFCSFGYSTVVSLWNADKKVAIVGECLTDKTLTADHLAPGTYYIKVSQGTPAYTSADNGTYTIQAVFTNADDNLTESEPNDTIDAAKPFTGNQATGIIGYSDYLSYRDKEDWFSYEVTHYGKLELKLIENTGSLYYTRVYLWKPDKSTIVPYSYNDHLSPGTYYIQVSLGSSSSSYDYGNYTVQAVFTNADDNLTESEPNDTIDAAKPFTGNQVTGLIGYRNGIQTDKEDWFRYEVTHYGKLELKLIDNTGSLYSLYYSRVYLWKPDKSGLVSYYDHLAPGTYYIQVSVGSSSSGYDYGKYTVQAVFTNADDNLTESEPNNTIDAAKPLTGNQVNGVLGYTDYINPDMEDWFSYEVIRSGKLVLNFTYTGSFSSGGTYVYLWKPDKSGYLTAASMYGKSLTRDKLSPGTYYIQVKRGSGDWGNYTIQAAFTPDASSVGLQDEIVCLRILSGIPVSSSEIIITDISKDGRIGMEECLYILQVVAGLRP